MVTQHLKGLHNSERITHEKTSMQNNGVALLLISKEKENFVYKLKA